MRQWTSRERVLAALARAEPDRVPLDYYANPGLDRRLKAHFGLVPDDGEGLARCLALDMCGGAPAYIGPPLHTAPEGRFANEWGFVTRWIEHGKQGDGYYDFCDFPLENADEETVANFPLPNPDHYDYDGFAHRAETAGDRAFYYGGAGLGDNINGCCRVRGLEQTLVDIATDDPAGLLYIDRRRRIELAIMDRALDRVGSRVDFVWMGEDLGSQRGPLIGLDLFRRQLRPRLQAYVDSAKMRRLPVMIHSCGSSRGFFDDFVEMGIAAVDTIQPDAEGMDPVSLKRDFGDRLAFHGGITTGRPVAGGGPEEVRALVKRTLEALMPGGGYLFAPAHALQDDTSVENALALYQAARDFGLYPSR